MKASSHTIFWPIAVAMAGALILAGSARAQNATQDVPLVEGWNAIWLNHSWSSTLKSAFDGLLYGLATGTIFALLGPWP